MSYELTMPSTLDLLHLILAGLSLVLLLVLGVVTLGRSSKQAEAKEAVPPPAVDDNPEIISKARVVEPGTARPAEPASARQAEPATARAVQPTRARTKETAKSGLTISDPVSALQLLGLLQQEARLVDFLQESLDGATDDQVGAVARVVHEGGKKVLDQYFKLEPIRQEMEESQITLEPGFDAGANRVTGNVSGEPPFTGILLHTGWRAVSAELPKLAKSHDPYIIAPAEVEL